LRKSRFDRLARHYDLFTKLLMMGTYGRVRERIVSTPRVRTALDLCSGTGYVTGWIKAERVVALDLSPTMLEVNREKNSGRKGVGFVVGDAFNLPFPESSFDAVFNTLAAHEFRDIEPVLRESWRVLRKGGLLVLYDFSTPESALLRHTYMPFLKHVVELGAFHVYTEEEWRDMLARTGFSEVEGEKLYKASILLRARK